MATPLSNDSFLQWDPAQVANYIGTSTDLSTGSLFLTNNLDGLLLPYLTTENLKELGIEKLSLRLQVKRSISELILTHQQLTTASIPISVNNNFLHVESLSLSLALLRESFNRIAFEQQQQHLRNSAPPSPNQQQLEIQKLQENLAKLKSELIPAMRLIKESKPLPTPTLDPGSTIGNLDSPTFSVLSPSTFSDFNTSPGKSSSTNTSAGGLGSSFTAAVVNAGNSSGTSSEPRTPLYPPASPTLASNRFSAGTVLSMGTGKIIQQSVFQDAQSHDRRNFTLQKINNRAHSATSGPIAASSVVTNGSNNNATNSNATNRPRIVETKPSLSTLSSQKIIRPLQLNNTLQAGLNPPTAISGGGGGSSEPLKQLRASSEDSCLKILQQAMKRHHIPRDDWLKYVLVICYGDKERILKLAEKPVIIFKELQELGKHPAIMLRQLATTTKDDESIMYEDLRIGDDIPGGTL